MEKRCISLLSGGLDSLIATKLIMEQNIEVLALHFKSPFSNMTAKEGEGQAIRSAKELGTEIFVEEMGMEYVRVIQNPKYGYGKNMNPCIDCKIYMLKRAKETMIEKKGSFIITGEVVGQRPMSQRKNIMRLIEKEAGLEGLVLRPLSARCLPPTKPEIEGIINREGLLNASGRGRKVQLEQAKRYNLKEFSSPGGGCLLTDPNFSRKIKDLFEHKRDFSFLDIQLLRIGRHIRIDKRNKFIVGRNEEENKRLEESHKYPFLILSLLNSKGPKAILDGEREEKILRIGASILAHYGKYKGSTVLLSIKGVGNSYECHSYERIEIDISRYLL